jgi:hypothetical protein
MLSASICSARLRASCDLARSALIDTACKSTFGDPNNVHGWW